MTTIFLAYAAEGIPVATLTLAGSMGRRLAAAVGPFLVASILVTS